jgi:hypothetical protein
MKRSMDFTWDIKDFNSMNSSRYSIDKNQTNLASTSEDGNVLGTKYICR